MAAYQMTAADRRALANIQARERQLKARRSITSNSQTAGVSQSKENADPVLRGAATVHDLGQNVDRGVYKSLEGIVDFGAGIVGAVGGLFSDDFENNVKRFIETDWTEKIMESPIGSMRSGVVGMVGGLLAHKNKLSDYSYLEEGGTIEQVAQGVGQMLPAVAISLATAGAAAPAAAGGTAASGAAAKVGALAAKNSGLLTIGASAAGTSTEEAYKDGASYGAGLGYGALSGATEMFTEKLLPGPADAVIGKSLLGGVRKGVAAQGVKRVVKDVVGNAINEGFEEMVSEATNPLRKSIYKGVEAFEEYADPEFYKSVGEAGKTGALTSVAFGGTVGRAIQGKGYNGDIDASIESIKALDEERSKIQERDGKISSEDNERIDKLIDENYKQIERVLKAKGVENMSDTIERYGLESNFDEGGNYARDTMDTAGLDGAYYSADARGQEVSIREVLDEQGVTAYKGELTADETEAWKETLKAHNALNKLGYVGKKLVIVDEMSNNNAFISDDVIVIGKDMLTNGEHIKRLVHETTHFTEGSTEWKSLAKYVLGKGSNLRTRLSAELGEIVGKKYGYGVTEADVDALSEYIDGGYKGKLTATQRTLAEELIANRMGNIFSDKASIEHLCREQPSLAKKIWERIKAIVDSFGKSASEREEIKKLRETERLFRAALETGGQSFIADTLYGVDNQGEVQYNKKGKTKKYPLNYRVGSQTLNYIRNELRGIYDGVSDGIADGIAIAQGEYVYIIDSGKDNGRLDFGIRERIKFADAGRQYMKEIVRRLNNDAITEGLVSPELFKRLRGENDSDSQSDLRRESGAELSGNQGESADNESGVSEDNADRGGLNTPEEAKRSGKISDVKFSLKFAPDIAENQRKYYDSHDIALTEDELDLAINQTAEMVSLMEKYSDILPQDKVATKAHRILVKNGSYDYSVENTTVCVRTLSYNSFVDRVSEKIGRPLSQMESFLVSQKLYDIAKEPQCLYCYVSLDRKAYNEMLLRYLDQRDAAVQAYKDAGMPIVSRSSELYKDFLDSRKDTDQQWNRYKSWMNVARNGGELLTAEDIATESRRAEIFAKGGERGEQIKDILKYAQSASWAKKQMDYVAYYDEILKLSDTVVRNLNKHYGLRWYSFSDYSAAFIVENMQQITDASLRGLKGLAYTKDTDFVKVFAPTGMNINISVYAKKDGKGGYVIDEKQSANIDEAIALREQFPNVGIVVVATDHGGVEWALEQKWSDVVIPFHTVRTGADVAEFYNWEIFNSEQSDTVKDANLWEAYVNSVATSDKAKKKVSKMVYPSEHQNNRAKYLAICEQRGLNPRFSGFVDNPNYMKLVNETRQSESATEPLKPTFDLDAAKESFDKFVDKGGYFEGWYNDGIDVDGEAELVAADVRAGKKANEVSYGRQDLDPDQLMAQRKGNRTHGGTAKRSGKAQDAEYLDAVESGDMETAQRMVDEAAREAGYDSPMLYHGTNRFGFTVFDTNRGHGFIYGSTKSIVAANYGGRDNYASVRKIGKKYISPDSHEYWLDPTRAVIQNADSVLGRKYKVLDDTTRQTLRKDVFKQADDVAIKLDELYVYLNLPYDINEDLSWVTDVFYTIRENDSEFFSDDADYKERWVSSLQSSVRHYNESYPNLRDYLVEHLNEFDDDGKKFARFLMSYDLTDTAIDIEYKYLRAVNPTNEVQYINTNTNQNIVTREQLQDIIDKVKDIGAYSLYGNVGDKPLVVDADGRDWLLLKVPEIGDDKYHSTDIVAEWAKNNDYSSVIVKNVYDGGERADDYVFFNSNQVKSADPVTYDDDGNVIPLSERFNIKHKDIRRSGKAQDENVPRPLLNRTRFKTYTHADAEKVISSILLNKLSFNDGSRGEIKNRGELADRLYLALNTAEKGKRAGVALDIAEYIIQHTAMKGVYDDAENAEFTETVSLLKSYLHSFNLSSIYEEMKHRYGKKKANGIRLLWGAPKGSGFTPDEVKSELEGSGFRIDSDNEADIFFEIADAYHDASEALKKKTNAMLDEVISEEERKQLKQDIVREILDGFELLGKPSMIATMLAEADKKAQLWKGQYYDQRNRGKAINRLFETVDRVRNIVDMKKADEEIAEEVENLVKLLKKIKTYRGNIAKNVRDIMKSYASEVGGTKLYDLISDKLDGEINPFAAEIESIAQGDGELSTREIEALDSILRNFIHNANNYKRIFLDGKRQEATEVIKQGVTETREALKVKNEGLLGVANKMKEHMQSPVWRFERLGCYRDNSVMVKLWKEFQNGFSRQARFSMQVAEHYKEFFEKHKKEVDKWRDPSYEINGQKVSRGQMIGLYLTALRAQGREHLFGDSDNGTVLFTDEAVTAKRGAHAGELEGANAAVSAGDIIEFEASLADTEREFIKLTQTFFNEISKNAKVETDEAMYGVSNVVETAYYPLRVADDQLYRKLGDGTFRFADLFNLYSPSFNKATVEHARNKLVIENVLDVVNRHAKQMANYYGFASAVKTFNRVYNMKVDGVGNMRDAIRNVDRSFEDYVGKLVQDIQGNRMPKTGIQRTLSKVRGWGARAALAANLKVLATQFVSMPAAAAVGVQYRYVTKGFGMAIKRKTDVDKMFEYVPMLYDRFRNGSNIDVGLLKEGRGILGDLDKLTDITTAPIGAIDSFVCCAVWNACLEQTKGKYTPYSEEHYKAAAELTESALIKTQANYAPLYRPAILREQDSFTQLLTMFMSEPLQQFSLISSSVEKLKVTRNLAENADDAHKAEYEKLFEEAKKGAAHALSAVFIDTVILTLIAQLFKWIKGKEDEDKVSGILGDFVENYVGMFPIIKDVYGYIVNGYDMTNMAYTGLTNIADGLTAMYSLIDLAVSGDAYDERQVRQKGRKILLGISQTFGIPLRNLETYMIGIIEKFSPSTGIKYDDLFYSESASVYTDKLMKAVDNGNDRLADSILDIMLDEGSTDKSLRTEMRKLLGDGMDVLPRSVGETVTYNGESVTLTKKQKSRFSALYSVAGDRAAKLVKTSLYRKADGGVKSAAIKFIYDTYYNLALQDMVGEELESKNVLFAEAMDIEQLAIIVAYARSLEADTDRTGKPIAGSKKAKIERYIQSLGISAAEKYMMMGYLGYKCTNGASVVKGYINRLNLTKAEKERLYEYCGYSA